MALQAGAVPGQARPTGSRPTLGIPANTTAAPKADGAAKRFHLLGAAQRIMGDREAAILRDGSPGWEYRYRVARCHRDTRGAAPTVYRTPKRDRAEYRDVYTCGSVWHCPVCAGKVTSKRREELSAALAVWTESGGEVALLTLTHAHEKDARSLDAQLELERKAYSWVSGTRAWRAVMQAAHCAGTVRALEVTHGEWHGWHPHRHILAFVAPGQLRTLDRLRKLWVRALLRVGLVDVPAHPAERFRKLRHLLRYAVDVRDGRFAAEYVAKFGVEPATDRGGRWGVGSELTKSHAKDRSPATGRTPFTLLAEAAEGGKRSAMLFREYAAAFHGARQLYWTNGFRGRLVELARQLRAPDMFLQRRWIAILERDRDDDAIAADPDAMCSEKVIRIEPAQWRVILQRRARGLVLELARTCTEAELRFLFGELARAGPPLDDGEFRADDWTGRLAA